MKARAVIGWMLWGVASVWAGDFGGRFAELEAKATPAQLYALLYDLPKGGDLHNHAGGANRAEWIHAVCTDPARNGGDVYYTRVAFPGAADAIDPAARYHTIRRYEYERLPAAARAEYARLDALTAEQRAGWLGAFVLDEPGEGRKEFFDVIWKRLGQVTQNPAVRFELLAENMKAFAAEGVCYLETQMGVDGLFDNDGRPIAPETALAQLRQRLAGPDLAGCGLTVRFQLTVLRFAKEAEKGLAEDYEWVAGHRDLWVGLNFAGIEENGKGYPLRFLDTLRELRRRLPAVPLSIHAGEMDGPDHHVRDTLLLGASRIGHGVNLIQDPDTLLLLQQTRRVLVEINLISNRLLDYVPDPRLHPFPEYLRTGVPVCLNTDDRGMWDSNLTDEYYTAVTAFHLSWDEVVALGRMSLEHAFVGAPEKARLRAAYEARVAKFEARYGAGDLAAALADTAKVKPVTYGYARRTWGLSFPDAGR